MNDQEKETNLPSRDSLALMRTRLANERTLLAYARTAFMFAVAGATVLKLYGEISSMAFTGWGLITVAIGVVVFGVHRFRKIANQLT